MIALFVTMETRDPGPAPTRVSASSSAVSSARAGGGDLLRGRLALEQDDETRRSPWPYQKSPSTSWNSPAASPRNRCSGPSSKTPYASSLACSARPHSPAAAAAWTRSSVAAITSKSAVSAASRHAFGNVVSISPSAASVVARSSSGSATDRREWPRQARRRAGQLGAELPRRRRVSPQQRRLEIAEGTGRAIPERDRLLDLEVEHHAPSRTPRPYSIGTSRRKRSS